MVLKLRCNFLAMSRVVRPCQISRSTSCSRGVSGWRFMIDYGLRIVFPYPIVQCRLANKRPSARAKEDNEWRPVWRNGMSSLTMMIELSNGRHVIIAIQSIG